MKTRRSFHVAGKIAFVLWRHGQRRNGTMPTMRAALLCLLLQRSAWIPRARSPSRIERSRTRLPVGLHSLLCENRSSQTPRSSSWRCRCCIQLAPSHYQKIMTRHMTLDDQLNSTLQFTYLILGDITPSYVSPKSLCNCDFRGVVLSL